MPPITSPYMVSLLTLCLTTAGVCADRARSNPQFRPGEIVLNRTNHGEYAVYIPKRRLASTRVLAVVHGSPEPNRPTIELAHTFIQRWVVWAEQRSVILIAPAFDEENFGGPGGGYRGLFGRHVGADEFLDEIVDQYAELAPAFGKRFSLYGHSAGGQFVGRYVVRHPDRVISAVLSAPGRMAFPDLEAEWPYGMGPLHRTMRWADDPVKLVDLQPDPETWVAASTLPLTVVVGSADVEPQPERPGQKGTSRIEIGRNWVTAMNAYAKEKGKRGRVRFVLVPNIGHNSAALTEACSRYVLLK